MERSPVRHTRKSRLLACGGLLLLAASSACGARSGLTCLDDACAEDLTGAGGLGTDSTAMASGGSSAAPPDEGTPIAVGGRGGSFDEGPDFDGLAPTEPEPIEDPSGAPGPDPAENRSCEAPPRVSTREELRALRGCTRITGALEIGSSIFSGDLSPLSSLEIIDGSLVLGAGVSSLTGLAALRRAEDLRFQYTDLTDLIGLGSSLQLDDESQVGLLIEHNDELTSLTGLPSLTGVENVEVLDNPQLREATFALPRALTSLKLVDNPQLAALSVPGVESVRQRLELRRLGLSDLTALSDLQFASQLLLVECPALTSLRGLERLAAADLLRIEATAVTNLDPLIGLAALSNLIIEQNPALVHIDGVAGLTTARQISVSGNPALTHLPTFSNLTEIEDFIVSHNERLSVAPTLPQLTSLDRLDIQDNASLTEVVGFSSLQRIRQLRIDHNPQLSALDLSALTSVEVFVNVTCNQALPAASVEQLANLDARRVDLSGNLGSSEPCSAASP